MPPHVSVIIPVYNSAPYLRCCLDSVIRQSLKNLEIICVNDCSTDESSTILHEYKHLDNRMIVIDFNANMGEAISRNTAIQRATGKWLGFIDSDDFVDINFFKDLCNIAHNKDADIIKGCVKWHYLNDKTRTINNNKKIKESKFNFKDCFWSAIYRRSLIEDGKITFYPKLICGADITFLIQAVTSACKILTSDNTFYNYVRRKNSMASDILSIEKIKSIVIARNFVVDYINAANIEYNDYMLIFFEQFNVIRYLPASSEPDNRIFVCKYIAENLIYLYSICKYKTDLLNTGIYSIAEFLKNKDIDGLAIYLLKKRISQIAEECRTKLKLRTI